MREGRVIRNPGYDGEFGTIRLFGEGELMQLAVEGMVFGSGKPGRGAGRPKACRSGAAGAEVAG